MRIFKYIKKAGFLLVIIVVNMLLSFLIEPASGASSRMWSGYYSEEELDTIFVGSSVCQQTFIPAIFDEKLGVKSYNMGTPSQAMPQTVRAIEVALREHDIKTIVYAMGFSSLKYEPIPEAEITFESARTGQKGGLAGVMDTISYMYSEDVIADEKSINFLFPWLYNYEDLSKATMMKNAKAKIENLKEYMTTGKYDATEGLKKGFRNDDTSVFNYDNRFESNTDIHYEPYFNADMLAEFEEMLKLCNEKNVDLIIVNTPHPVFDVLACHEYYENNEKRLKDLCELYGVDYYDFSLAKDEIYEVKEEHFCDFEHLNKGGAQDFCEKLSDFMARRAAGENMDAYFYSVEEFLELHTEELEEWK